MTIINEYLPPCFYSFMACISFTLVFNIHGREQLVCGIGGAIGWLVYILLDETIFAAFAAAAAIGAFSEIMARVIRCPATGNLLVALLPLVPGGGIYYAMSYCLEGDTERFISALLDTLGLAAALAVGVILASSLFRTAAARLIRPRRYPDGKEPNGPGAG